MKQKRWMTSVIAAAAEAAKGPMPALSWTRQARATRSATTKQDSAPMPKRHVVRSAATGG